MYFWRDSGLDPPHLLKERKDSYPTIIRVMGMPCVFAVIHRQSVLGFESREGKGKSERSSHTGFHSFNIS